MNSLHVKGGLRLRTGARVEFCHDNCAVQAMARRLSVYAQIVEQLQRDVPERGAAALSCDGDALVAILAWEGFADASRNGWLAARVAPISDENGRWLEQFARTAIGAGAVRR